MAGCQSKSKKPVADPQQIPLENKVVNKIIAPKVTNDGHSFQKEVPILCYHNIKDFDSRPND
jgi:hypothetical protein